MPDGQEGTVQVPSDASTPQAPAKEPPADAFELPDLSTLPFQPANEAPAVASETLLPTPHQADALPRENGSGTTVENPTTSGEDLRGLLEDLSQIENASDAPAESSEPLLPTPAPADALPRENGSGTPAPVEEVNAAADVQRLLAEIQELVSRAEDLTAPPPTAPVAVAEGPTWTPSGQPRDATPSKESETATKNRKTKKTKPPTPAEERAKKREARQRLAMLALVLIMSSVVAPILSSTSTTHAYTIASDSMAPTMPKGSFVLASAGEVHNRDVVVYMSHFTGTLQVHRIVEIREEDGKTSYVARGDHNEAPDSVVVRPEDIQGVVKFNAPVVGYLWLMPVWLQVTIFASFTLIYLGITLWDARSAAGKRKAKVAAVAIVLVLLLVFPYASAGAGAVYPASAHTVNINSDANPWSAGTSNGTSLSSVTTITGSNHQAAVTLASPKVWKEVEVWGCSTTGTSCDLSVTSGTYTKVAGDSITLDPGDFTPDPTVYLEAYVSTAATANISVKMRDTTDNAWMAASDVFVTNQVALGIVRSAPFSLNAGADTYNFYALSSITATIRSLKVVMYQQFPTTTETQVRVASGSETTSATGSVATYSNIFRYDAANFDGTIASAFECVFNQAGTGIVAAGDIDLVRTDTSASVASMAPGLGAGEQFKRVSVTLADGISYRVEYQSPVATLNQKMTLYQCRVVIAQTGTVTKTTNYENMIDRATSSGTGVNTVGFPVRIRMDSELNWRKDWFEFTSTASSVATQPLVRVNDNTAAATMTGSSINVDATTRKRFSSDVTPNTSNGTYTMEIQHAGVGQTVTVYSGFLVSRVQFNRGHTYDYAIKSTPKSGGCTGTWSFTLEQKTSTLTSSMTNATWWIRGNGVAKDQIVWAGGSSSFTKTIGTAVSVTSGTAVEVLVHTNRATAGSHTMGADLAGQCGGVRSVQRVTFTLT